MPTLDTMLPDIALDHTELIGALFSASGNYIVITDPVTGLIVAISDAWLSTLEYQRDEIVGKTSGELNIWLYPDQRQEMIRRIKTVKVVSRFHTRLRGKNGAIHDFSITIQIIKIKSKNFILFTGHDITDELQIKNSILTSRKILIDALEAMSEGFVLYGKDRRLIVCNSKFKEFYGYSDEEVAVGASAIHLGKLDIERGTVLIKRDSSHTYIQRREYMEKGPQKSTVVQLKDGRYLLLSDRVTDEGNIVSIQKDITELKMTEIALVKAKDDADIANNTKSEFLAHMSHELRTPLNSILGFTQVMHDELLGKLGHPKYKEYINDVHHSGQHLLNLINDVLDISKVEAGEFVLHEDTLDLKDTIAACLQIIRGKQDVAALNIIVKSSEGNIYFRGDERIMRQIILNLLSNAIKFTKAEGNITISLTKGDANGVNLSISDTGCGIVEDDISLVLAPFGQARTNARTAHEGTGLGLSLSKMLTELHDGVLNIHSEVGVGTTVTLNFGPERTVEST